MKRKAAEDVAERTDSSSKRVATEANSVLTQFRNGLFDDQIVKNFGAEYARSRPYKHAVVSELINDSLLRSVRSEILQHIHFTSKETDIYKIHQSGDLANLSGLSSSALKKLPSLLQLRDALYSSDFRTWVGEVSCAGALSGQKTDMAVNVYAPGCHLLCHDDVIGSRRVSYILYLTDPDKPWRADWGGALRLYPTEEMQDEDGKTFKVPRPDWVESIPPAWNQLSFFAVQPGESFHDVEEVYKRDSDVNEDGGGRVRMAISGWYHIPQEGEQGFEPGLAEKLAEKSSLQQLQGKADMFDLPQPQWHDPEASQGVRDDDDDDAELSEDDLQFLLEFLRPNYLTPDTVEELNELFVEESSLQLTNFLNKRFNSRLKEQILVPKFQRNHLTSRPPHKHRYQYLQPARSESTLSDKMDAYEDVLNKLLPSLAFRKWMSLVTGLTCKRCDVLARRFRRGMDYQLATGYEGEHPQLEYCLCVTPTPGWGGDEEHVANGISNCEANEADEVDNVGGYELYMAGDDADGDEGSDEGVAIPANAQSHTGAGERRSSKKKIVDPAIYTAAADDEDDGILFSNPASWNTMSIVLRDRGVLKFVKYVSHAAKGDRFDFCGSMEVEEDGEQDELDEVQAGAETTNKGDGEGVSSGSNLAEEEEWNGIED